MLFFLLWIDSADSSVLQLIFILGGKWHVSNLILSYTISSPNSSMGYELLLSYLLCHLSMHERGLTHLLLPNGVQ